MSKSDDEISSMVSAILVRQGISTGFECTDSGSIDKASLWLLHLKRGNQDKTFEYGHNERKLPLRVHPDWTFSDGRYLFIPSELKKFGYGWGIDLPYRTGAITVYERELRERSVPKSPNTVDVLETITYCCSCVYDMTYEEWSEEIGAPLDSLNNMNNYMEMCGYTAKLRSLGITIEELFDIFA